MKVTALGQIRQLGAAEEKPFLARPSAWILLGAAVVLGLVFVNEVQLERRRR